MSDKVTWLFPGPIPYSSAHLVVDAGDYKDPYEMAIAYTVALNLWTQGIEAGKKIDVVPGQATTAPFEGPPKLEPIPRADEPLTDGTYEKNITNLSQEDAQRIISEGLGESAPWEGEAKADPKPWEKGAQKAPRKVESIKTPTVGNLF